MARSKWKFYFICKSLQRYLYFKKCKITGKHIKKHLYTRSTIIPQGLYKSTILIHKGNEFKQLFVVKRFFNYKVGEFAFTRKPFYYPVKEKKVKKKKR